MYLWDASPVVGGTINIRVTASSPVALLWVVVAELSPSTFDQQSNTGTGRISGTSSNSLNITPSASLGLSLAAIFVGESSSSPTFSINSPFSILQQGSNNGSGRVWGLALAADVYNTNTNIQPAWSWTVASNGGAGMATYNAKNAASVTASMPQPQSTYVVGTFDDSLNPQAWFDDDVLIQGWFDPTLILSGSFKSSGMIGAGAVSGSLTGATALADDISGSSTVTATFTGSGAMSSSVDGASSITALLTGAGAIASILAGTSSVSGSLTGAGALAAVLNGNATVSAVVIGSGELDSNIDGTSSATVVLTGTGALASVLDGLSSVTVSLIGIGPLLSGIIGTSSVSLNSVSGALIASITGTSSVSANLTVLAAILAALTGSSSVFCTLNGQEEVVCEIGGIGSVNATIVISSSPASPIGRATVSARILGLTAAVIQAAAAIQRLDVLVDSIVSTPDNAVALLNIQAQVDAAFLSITAVYNEDALPLTPYTTLLVAIQIGQFAAQKALTLTNDLNLSNGIQLQYAMLLKAYFLLLQENFSGQAQNQGQ